MSLIETCGYAAALVACTIVVTGILLFALLAACVVLGACESVQNPHASEDARASYQNVTTEIAAGSAGFDRAVVNVTGG
jgi:hypothetical protein